MAIFASLLWLTAKRGATDPVCGMQVNRAKALTRTIAGETLNFCFAHCLHAFEADPERQMNADLTAVHARAVTA